jgi:hypothetical protein
LLLDIDGIGFIAIKFTAMLPSTTCPNKEAIIDTNAKEELGFAVHIHQESRNPGNRRRLDSR